MSLPHTFVRLSGLVLVAGMAFAPAWAQIRSTPPLSVDGQSLVLSTHEQRLAMPTPDWVAPDVAGDAVLSSFEAIFRTGESEADLEIYRNGAVYAMAKEIYGARIIVDPAATLAAYRGTILTNFSNSCASRPAFVQLGEAEDDIRAPLLMVCGAQRSNLRQGEIVAVSMQGQQGELAVVYQQWRGAAFDPTQTASWPVPSETLQARARQLQAETSFTQAN